MGNLWYMNILLEQTTTESRPRKDTRMVAATRMAEVELSQE